MTKTHAVLMNGRTWMDVHSIDDGEANDIGATLARLDGIKLYSLLLWKLPPGTPGGDSSAVLRLMAA